MVIFGGSDRALMRMSWPGDANGPMMDPLLASGGRHSTHKEAPVMALKGSYIAGLFDRAWQLVLMVNYLLYLYL